MSHHQLTMRRVSLRGHPAHHTQYKALTSLDSLLLVLAPLFTRKATLETMGRSTSMKLSI